MNRYHYQNPGDPAEIMDAVSVEELASLKSRGVLHDNSLVAPEGTENWTALKNVVTSGARVIPAPPIDPSASDTETKERPHNPRTASPNPEAKKFYPTFFLGLFFGVFGVHSFYNGKTRNGILQLVTFGGLGVWWLIDMILILTGNFKDKQENKIPNINPKVSWAVFVVAVLIGLVSGGGSSSSDSGSSSRSSESSYSVEGLYAGPGMYGFGGTIELLYGGSFIMKDPGLPSGGPMFGDWSGTTRNIEFFSDGMNVFSGRIDSSGDLIIGGRTYERKR